MPHDHNKAMHKDITIAPVPLFKLHTAVTLDRAITYQIPCNSPTICLLATSSFSYVLLHPKASIPRILRTNGPLCFRLFGSLSKALRASLKVSYSL